MAQGPGQTNQTQNNVSLDVNINSNDMVEAITDVLGTTLLVDPDGRMNVEANHEEIGYYKILKKSGDNLFFLTHGYATCSVQLTGQWTGPLAFEASLNGQDWVPINGISASIGLVATSASVPDLWRFNIAGLLQFRVRAGTDLSGCSCNVYAMLSAGLAYAENIQGIQPKPIGSVGPLQQDAYGRLLAADPYRTGLLENIYMEMRAQRLILAEMADNLIKACGGKVTYDATRDVPIT